MKRTIIALTGIFFSAVCGAQAQEYAPPLSVSYSCDFATTSPASTKTYTGNLDGRCFPPNSPVRDAYRCLLNANFQTKVGSAGIGVNLLLPSSAFKNPNFSNPSYCLSSTSIQFDSSRSAQVANTQGFLPGFIRLANCPTFILPNKPFVLESYSFPPGEAQGDVQVLTCQLVIQKPAKTGRALQ